MASHFPKALRYLAGVEGGRANIPGDTGGLTMRGITTATWRRYLRAKGQRFRPVTTATPAETRDVYRTFFWDDQWEAFPFALAVLCFDVRVHSGPKVGVRILQRVVGSGADGVIGPNTRRAVKRAVDRRGARAIARDFIDQRASQLHDLDNAKARKAAARGQRYARVSKGWHKRMRRLQEASFDATPRT